MVCEVCGLWHDSISALSACLEEAEDAYYAAEAEAEQAAELANERWFEERGGGYYAGSEEEARDRFFDSLIGR